VPEVLEEQAREVARLRWRCRRGMRELDVLLERYLAERYPGTGAGEQLLFTQFLELPDPDVAALLLGHTSAPRWEPLVTDITRPAPRELSDATPVYECDPAGGRLPGAGP
jgi:antitoxin CptB